MGSLSSRRVGVRVGPGTYTSILSRILTASAGTRHGVTVIILDAEEERELISP
jgi:hypothetical protein